MICNFPTFVLFDSGATHSFISLLHAKTIKYQVEPLENGLYISTLSDEVILVELVCRNCEIRFGVMETVDMRSRIRIKFYSNCN